MKPAPSPKARLQGTCRPLDILEVLYRQTARGYTVTILDSRHDRTCPREVI